MLKTILEVHSQLSHYSAVFKSQREAGMWTFSVHGNVESLATGLKVQRAHSFPSPMKIVYQVALNLDHHKIGWHTPFTIPIGEGPGRELDIFRN